MDGFKVGDPIVIPIEPLTDDGGQKKRLLIVDVTPAIAAFTALGAIAQAGAIQLLSLAQAEAEREARADEAAGIFTIEMGSGYGIVAGNVLRMNGAGKGNYRVISVRPTDRGTVVLRLQPDPGPLKPAELIGALEALAKVQEPSRRPAPKLSKHDIRQQNRRARDQWRKR